MPNDPRRKKDEDRPPLREAGVFTIIPMLLLAGPAVGYWIGLQIQNRWGGEPWWTVGGIVFGLAAAVRQIIRLIREGGLGR